MTRSSAVRFSVFLDSENSRRKHLSSSTRNDKTHLEQTNYLVFVIGVVTE